MAIQDDHNTLNTTESGNQDLLSKLHRDLETPNLSPSRKLNIYIKTSYVFPFTIHINNLDAFSNTLLRQRKWTDSQILRKRNIILDNDRAAVKKFFLKQKTTTVEVAILTF